MATHLAAVSLAKNEPFEIQARPTPNPGPGELLIAVKSVAFNPVDYIMRDTGLMVSTYPTIIGFDIAGLVLEVGDDVPVGSPDEDSGLFFRPGITRVAAYTAFVWRSFDPAYGAFQEQCLVPWQHAAPLPTEGISWNQAATLPVAAQVPLSVWDAIGIPRLGEAAAPSFVSSATTGASTSGETRRGSNQKRDILLIWGASSSVGTMGVQSARLLREDHESSFAAVYATAGVANHTYVASLGADRVFDYKEPQVVDAIISAAREDGLVIRHCFLAMGQLAQCQAVLKAFLADSQEGERHEAKIGSAPPVSPDAEMVDGVEAIFVQPSMVDEGERLAQFHYWLGTWLRENLAKRKVRPSPEPRVVGKGVGAINAGIDAIRRGVSCAKLVVEVAE